MKFRTYCSYLDYRSLTRRSNVLHCVLRGGSELNKQTGRDGTGTSEAIRAARAVDRWSASQLAERAGVGLSTIQRMENGDGVQNTPTRTLRAVQCVEVTGIDLRQPLDDATRKALHQAAADNIWMVIRDQTLTPEQYSKAVTCFGEVMDLDHPKYGFPGLPGIKRHSNHNLDSNGNRLKDGEHWHTDGTFRERPPKFTILYAVELPSSGGDTKIMNMREASEALPGPERSALAKLQTANVRQAANSHYRTSANNEAIMARGDQVATIHPLVRTIPDTGKKNLWFSAARVEHIVGMDPEDSQALLQDLMNRLIRPEFIYSHSWRVGDIFLWDNRQSLHKAMFDYDPAEHRLLYNCSTLGERPV